MSIEAQTRTACPVDAILPIGAIPFLHRRAFNELDHSEPMCRDSTPPLHSVLQLNSEHGRDGIALLVGRSNV